MLERLMCPVSGKSLVEVDRGGLSAALGEDIRRLAADRPTVRPEELTDTFLLRSDGAGAYPVVEGIPILMAPEMLVSAGNPISPLDTDADPYREAYVEMGFYNSVATGMTSDLENSPHVQEAQRALGGAQFPSLPWLEALYELPAQAEAYEFLSPIEGMTMLQVGGKGVQAVKFLLAGAKESWVLTPMLGEALHSRELADACGVGDRLRAVVGIAEEIPCPDASFDRVYSGGCIHHTTTDQALPEIKRVLTGDGRFAAVEPWRAPLYRLGTKVFGKREQAVLGKREKGILCRPMDDSRVAPLARTFDRASVSHHGTFTRYGLIALRKLGVRPKPETVDRIMRADDRLADKLSAREFGSCVVLMGQNG